MSAIKQIIILLLYTADRQFSEPIDHYMDVIIMCWSKHIKLYDKLYYIGYTKNIIFKHMCYIIYWLTICIIAYSVVFTQSNQIRLSDIQNVYCMIYIFSIQTRRMTIIVSC